MASSCEVAASSKMPIPTAWTPTQRSLAEVQLVPTTNVTWSNPRKLVTLSQLRDEAVPMHASVAVQIALRFGHHASGVRIAFFMQLWFGWREGFSLLCRVMSMLMARALESGAPSRCGMA